MTATAPTLDVAIDSVDVAAYTVPLGETESDGPRDWDSTTCVVVEARAGGRAGLGYTYGDRSVAEFIRSKLVDVVQELPALNPPSAWCAMDRAIRNAGRPGVGAMAVAAVDNALWDLEARLLDIPLCKLLGQVHDGVPIYGSGGFTSFGPERVAEQLEGWVQQGIPRVKMKVGRAPGDDPARVGAARRAVGDDVALMVDANGAYTRKQALEWAERFVGEWGVEYFEEPVTSEDLEGLRLLRDRGPAGMAIAAGEYAWTLPDFLALVDKVDVLQADVTRCGGITNFRRVDGLCKAHTIPFSVHCAPALSVHPACAVETLVHLEYFHDHVRLESLLFDGTLDPRDGVLRPDLSRSGNGLELKRSDAAKYEV
jgi:L-alanine-DL-glutamate epimerase-like enolase superfamily enzyme